MKTKQQVGECIYKALAHTMAHPGASGFHTDARLREDLALDSAATLQLLVSLELELGLGLPEEAVMNGDLATVRNVAKLLFDAQTRPESNKILEYEDDIKLHCFVSCLSEVIKRRVELEHRVLYFGVWDSEIVASERGISYHSETIDHTHFLDWYERLYGIKVEAWYDDALSKDENCVRLAALVEKRAPDEHLMVMLNMHQLPERANEFNKDPFPHYLMVGPTQQPDEWFVYDPDYRWEGIAKRERILAAMHHPSVRGGYIFADTAARAPQPRAIKAYFEASMKLDENPMTEAIRRVLMAHLAGRDAKGEPLALAGLGSALDEVPILAIRKYAYEHGFGFFWRELTLDEAEFDAWIEVIATLVKTYKLVQFQAMKLAASGDRALAERIFALLNEQDQRERQLKQRLQEVYRQWCEQTSAAQSRAREAGVSS